MTEEYQGWPNAATWNVALWINNDQDNYIEMRQLRPFTPLKAELFCIKRFGSQTPDGHRLSSVIWSAIAEDFNAD